MANERVHAEPRDIPDEFAEIDSTGARLLLVRSNASVPPSIPLGYTDVKGTDTVGVHVMVADDLPKRNTSQRAVLAHEFVHVLQHQHGLHNLSESEETVVTDRIWARWAVYEGDAMLTQLAYQRRYDVDGVGIDRYRRPNSGNPRGSWPAEFSRASYYYGTRYLRMTNATNGTARNATLRAPPQSTRLLLHPNATPVNRSLRLPTTLADDRYASIGHDRFGELAVRRALVVNGLSRERAVAASTGWQDGYMSVYYGGSGETGAWRTRWTNASEATEFLTAYRDALHGLNGTREDERWRIASPTAPETFYHIERANTTVTIVAGGNRTSVDDVAVALPETNVTAGA